MGLIFDGVDLEERFGFMIDGAGTWAVPKRDQELIHVPGRNGDLIVDHGCWQNVNITYRFLIKDGWIHRFDDFCRWAMDHKGYFVLEDPERHPDVYRMAAIIDEIKPTLWFRHRQGIFEITFSCKPEQYTFDGDTVAWQLLVPMVGGGFDMLTGYVPKAGNEIRVIPHIDRSVSGEIAGQILVYNSSKTQVETSGEISLTDGVEWDYTITTGNAAYWQLEIFCGSTANIDKIYAEVISDTILDGETKELNAIFGRQTPKFQNPTGYMARPIMTYYGSKGWSVSLTNYNESGGKESYFYWTITDFSAKSTKGIMDCEMQSFYYEYEQNGYPRKGNLGGYLTLTEGNNRRGQALSFPFIGEAAFDFYMQAGTMLEVQNPGLIEIVPKWVTI